LWERFSHVVENWYGIMSRTKRLTAFTSSYSQAAVVFPYILVAPAFFADKIQLGGLTQTANAFGSVQKALWIFVTIYRSLADWRAIVARLDGFEMSIRAPRRWQIQRLVGVVSSARRRSTCATLWSVCPTAPPRVADRLSLRRRGCALPPPIGPANRPCSAPSRHLAIRGGRSPFQPTR
jgi:putative ATP-binding cassette transporter